MASPIKIRADADFSALLNAARDSGKSLEDLIADFDDVQKASGDAASEATRDLGKVSKASGKAGDDISRDFKGAFDDAAGEADQTAREVAASFDGSAESILSGFQELSANALSGFGPAGVAAGAAIAAGLGVGMQSLEKFNEALEDARDQAFGFASDMDALTKQVDYSASLASWTKDADRLKQAQDIAKVTGEDLLDVLDALAGGGDNLEQLRDSFERNAINTMDVTLGRVTELNGVLQGTAEGFANGAAGGELYARQLGRFAEEVGVATGEVDDLGNAIVTLPDGKQVVVDAETGQAFLDLDEIEKKKLTDKTVKVKAVPDTTMWDRWQPTGKTARVQAQMANALSPTGRFARQD